MMLVNAVRELMDVRGGEGINVLRMGGRVSISAIPRIDRYSGVATSDFAALSGSTPGTGTVQVYWYDGTNWADAGITVNAINVSTTTMTSGNSIDGGMAVWVAQDPFGTWYVAPMDCT